MALGKSSDNIHGKDGYGPIEDPFPYLVYEFCILLLLISGPSLLFPTPSLR